MRYVLALVALLLLDASSAKAWKDCPSARLGAMPGQCDTYIPLPKLPIIEAQQTIVWCWAAAAQAIFRYYGYDVDQSVIVMRGYGSVVVTTGHPIAMLRTLNHDYVDKNGKKFNVRTTSHHDAYSWMTGDAFAASLVKVQLTNKTIFEELANDRPIFYASTNHAMALVGASFVGSYYPIAGFVLDPAPLISVGTGPITVPGIPAKGLRQLHPSEMTSYFAAAVEVTPN